ncbi:MAG TPA: glycosyltransferase family 9 protein [Actinomycetota bacterium]|nr:glycosyltransferase family 9 protein [Actinomycetota bacterium]
MTALRLTRAAATPPVVVLRALGLGDLLTAIPALRALADAFPRHPRLLAVPTALAPLARCSGAVDEVVPAEGLDRPLSRLLHGAGLAVNLHDRGPESHNLLLEAEPRRLLAFAHPAVPASSQGPRWRADEHEVARWCRLLEESGIAADPGRLDIDLPPGPLPHGVQGATLVHPGAASPARRWPAERFAAVARAEALAGRSVVVTGGPAEAELAHEVAARAGLSRDAVHAGQNGVLALGRLVAAAGRVVCGDTGVAHLATALGTPSVVLFGPTSPALWGPPADRPWHRALWAGTSGDPHGRLPDPGLLAIAVDQVLAALDDLPAAPARDRVA